METTGTTSQLIVKNGGGLHPAVENTDNDDDNESGKLPTAMAIFCWCSIQRITAVKRWPDLFVGGVKREGPC